MLASSFLSYALAFWYGTTLVADDIERECTSGCVTGVRARRVVVPARQSWRCGFSGRLRERKLINTPRFFACVSYTNPNSSSRER